MTSVAAAPDPIAGRLLDLVLLHGEQLLSARRDGARCLGTQLAAVGLVAVFDGPAPGDLKPNTVRYTTTGKALALAMMLGLDVPARSPGAWPVVVFDRGEACVCWLSAAPVATGAPS